MGHICDICSYSGGKTFESIRLCSFLILNRTGGSRCQGMECFSFSSGKTVALLPHCEQVMEESIGMNSPRRPACVQSCSGHQGYNDGERRADFIETESRRSRATQKNEVRATKRTSELQVVAGIRSILLMLMESNGQSFVDELSLNKSSERTISFYARMQ